MIQYSLLISHRPRRPHPYGRCVAWLQGRAELEAALIKAVVQLLKSVKKQTVCHLSSYPPKFTEYACMHWTLDIYEQYPAEASSIAVKAGNKRPLKKLWHVDVGDEEG